jgi:hypothetical protein
MSLRMTCPRFCYDAGDEIDQINRLLLGHESGQTSEGSRGCKQRLRNVINDRIRPEPKTASSAYAARLLGSDSVWIRRHDADLKTLT